MRRLAALLAWMIAGAQLGAAQEPPCGEPAALEYRVRWSAPLELGAGVSSYVLVRLPAGGQGESIELPAGEASGGLHSAQVPGFGNARAWTLSLIARGPGGDSAPSNALELPALVSGPCPSGPPGSPTLRDVTLASPEPPPPAGAWPDASTTGPPAGTALRSCPGGPLSASADGCRFQGAVEITANGVTISNSVIEGRGANYAVHSGGRSLTGTVLRNLRVSGANGKCIYLQGGFIGEKLDIFGCEDGVFGSRFTLVNSYIHDVLTGGDRHSDGVQIPSGGQVVLRGNRIEVARGAANSAVFVQSNFGQVDNVQVESNRLSGGTFTVYTDAQGHPCPINVRWRSNTIVRGSSLFGVASVPCRTAAGWEWLGNRDESGAPIEP